MAGLINESMPQQKPGMAQKKAQPGSLKNMPEEKATDEEQEAFDRVVYAGMDVLHSEETKPKILEMLETGKENPGQILAQIAVMILKELDQKSGGSIPEEVILQSAEQILSLTAELAENSGIFQVDDKVSNSAAQNLLAQISESYDIDQSEVEELMKTVNEDEIKGIVTEQQGYDLG